MSEIEEADKKKYLERLKDLVGFASVGEVARRIEISPSTLQNIINAQEQYVRGKTWEKIIHFVDHNLTGEGRRFATPEPWEPFAVNPTVVQRAQDESALRACVRKKTRFVPS